MLRQLIPVERMLIISNTIILNIFFFGNTLTRAKAQDFLLHLIDMFWHQESSRCILVSGLQLRSGTPGDRDILFTYKSYEEKVGVKVTAGVPAQLKLIGVPEQVRCLPSLAIFPMCSVLSKCDYQQHRFQTDNSHIAMLM